MERWSCKIFKGAMVDAPVYESHKRGKNWMAHLVEKDPSQPGGFKREFLEKAKGGYYYFVQGLKPGDVVEWGADYFTTSGKRRRTRKYGVITRITEDEMEAILFDDPKEAFDYAETHLKGEVPEEIKNLQKLLEKYKAPEEFVRELDLAIKTEVVTRREENEVMLLLQVHHRDGTKREISIGIFSDEPCASRVKKMIAESEGYAGFISRKVWLERNEEFLMELMKTVAQIIRR